MRSWYSWRLRRPNLVPIEKNRSYEIPGRYPSLQPKHHYQLNRKKVHLRSLSFALRRIRSLGAACALGFTRSSRGFGCSRPAAYIGMFESMKRPSAAPRSISASIVQYGPLVLKWQRGAPPDPPIPVDRALEVQRQVRASSRRRSFDDGTAHKNLLAVNGLPAFARIELNCLARQRAGHRTQILFIDNAILVHDERFDT